MSKDKHDHNTRDHSLFLLIALAVFLHQEKKRKKTEALSNQPKYFTIAKVPEDPSDPNSPLVERTVLVPAFEPDCIEDEDTADKIFRSSGESFAFFISALFVIPFFLWLIAIAIR